MEDVYGLHHTVDYCDQSSMSPENFVSQADLQSIFAAGRVPIFGSDQVFEAPPITDASIAPEIRGGHGTADEISRAIKAKIASHPRYPRLLEAYLDCQKVGAPPEIASLLDEIRRENDVYKRNTVSTRIGADPELDEFMETYCDVLVKYKTDLARPFVEATTFLNNIEMQLSNLCKGASRSCASDEGKKEPRWIGHVQCRHKGGHSIMIETSRVQFSEWSFQLVVILFLGCDFDVQQTIGIKDRLSRTRNDVSNLCRTANGREKLDDPAGSSEEELSGGEIDVPEAQPRSEDRELKDKLRRKYSGCLSSLKQEFSKKKKKGKLPKEARQTLLDWWNMHYKWPYPTEADKIALAESTGLDQKQINNWFINQRKRHWKPSENMQFAVMDSVSGPFYVDE